MWCVYFAVLALLIMLWLLVKLVQHAPATLILLLTCLVHTQRYYTHGGISQA